jgi:hypothetical protein
MKGAKNEQKNHSVTGFVYPDGIIYGLFAAWTTARA